MQQGMIHLYTGDGKGKTTAAAGLALRAAGSGLSVLMVQFLKGSETGELKLLRSCGVRVLRNSRDYGFVKNMTPQELLMVHAEHMKNFDIVLDEIKKNTVDVLILDELMAAYNHRLIDEEPVKQLILQKPEKLELVMTGRSADAFFVEHSDYVTNMELVRHPFSRGIGARKGIEY
jgi:cob(I)alamin adenosyltransferase